MAGETNHLHEGTLLDLLEGRGSSGDRKHLESCAVCRAELAEWRALLEDLGTAANIAVASNELDQLGVLFRALGPLRKGCQEWIARLLSPPASAAVAVRGGAAVPIEHQAGPFSVAMQVRPAARDGVTVHGQVYSDRDEVVAGEVVLSDQQGCLRSGEIDELGEFSVPLPAGSCYRAFLLLPSSRIVIEQLEIPRRL